MEPHSSMASSKDKFNFILSRPRPEKNKTRSVNRKKKSVAVKYLAPLDQHTDHAEGEGIQFTSTSDRSRDFPNLSEQLQSRSSNSDILSLDGNIPVPAEVREKQFARETSTAELATPQVLMVPSQHPLSQEFVKLPRNEASPEEEEKISKQAIDRWCLSYEHEQSSFSSFAVFAEVRLREALSTSSRLGSPNPVQAAVVCDLLAKTAGFFGRFSDLLGLIAKNVLECIYADSATLCLRPGMGARSLYLGLPHFEALRRLRVAYREINDEVTLYQKGATLRSQMESNKRFVNIMFGHQTRQLRAFCFHAWRRYVGVQMVRVHLHRRRRVLRGVFVSWRFQVTLGRGLQRRQHFIHKQAELAEDKERYEAELEALNATREGLKLGLARARHQARQLKTEQQEVEGDLKLRTAALVTAKRLQAETEENIALAQGLCQGVGALQIVALSEVFSSVGAGSVIVSKTEAAAEAAAAAAAAAASEAAAGGAAGEAGGAGEVPDNTKKTPAATATGSSSSGAAVGSQSPSTGGSEGGGDAVRSAKMAALSAAAERKRLRQAHLKDQGPGSLPASHIPTEKLLSALGALLRARGDDMSWAMDLEEVRMLVLLANESTGRGGGRGRHPKRGLKGRTATRSSQSSLSPASGSGSGSGNGNGSGNGSGNGTPTGGTDASTGSEGGGGSGGSSGAGSSSSGSGSTAGAGPPGRGPGLQRGRTVKTRILDPKGRKDGGAGDAGGEGESGSGVGRKRKLTPLETVKQEEEEEGELVPSPVSNPMSNNGEKSVPSSQIAVKKRKQVAGVGGKHGHGHGHHRTPRKHGAVAATGGGDAGVDVGTQTDYLPPQVARKLQALIGGGWRQDLGYEGEGDGSLSSGLDSGSGGGAGPAGDGEGSNANSGAESGTTSGAEAGVDAASNSLGHKNDRKVSGGETAASAAAGKTGVSFKKGSSIRKSPRREGSRRERAPPPFSREGSERTPGDGAGAGAGAATPVPVAQVSPSLPTFPILSQFLQVPGPLGAAALSAPTASATATASTDTGSTSVTPRLTSLLSAGVPASSRLQAAVSILSKGPPPPPPPPVPVYFPATGFVSAYLSAKNSSQPMGGGGGGGGWGSLVKGSLHFKSPWGGGGRKQSSLQLGSLQLQQGDGGGGRVKEMFMGLSQLLESPHDWVLIEDPQHPGKGDSGVRSSPLSLLNASPSKKLGTGDHHHHRHHRHQHQHHHDHHHLERDHDRDRDRDQAPDQDPDQDASTLVDHEDLLERISDICDAKLVADGEADEVALAAFSDAQRARARARDRRRASNSSTTSPGAVGVSAASSEEIHRRPLPLLIRDHYIRETGFMSEALLEARRLEANVRAVATRRSGLGVWGLVEGFARAAGIKLCCGGERRQPQFPWRAGGGGGGQGKDDGKGGGGVPPACCPHGQPEFSPAACSFFLLILEDLVPNHLTVGEAIRAELVAESGQQKPAAAAAAAASSSPSASDRSAPVSSSSTSTSTLTGAPTPPLPPQPHSPSPVRVPSSKLKALLPQRFPMCTALHQDRNSKVGQLIQRREEVRREKEEAMEELEALLALEKSIVDRMDKRERLTEQERESQEKEAEESAAAAGTGKGVGKGLSAGTLNRGGKKGPRRKREEAAAAAAAAEIEAIVEADTKELAETVEAREIAQATILKAELEERNKLGNDLGVVGEGSGRAYAALLYRIEELEAEASTRGEPALLSLGGCVAALMSAWVEEHNLQEEAELTKAVARIKMYLLRAVHKPRSRAATTKAFISLFERHDLYGDGVLRLPRLRHLLREVAGPRESESGDEVALSLFNAYHARLAPLMSAWVTQKRCAEAEHEQWVWRRFEHDLAMIVVGAEEQARQKQQQQREAAEEEMRRHLTPPPMLTKRKKSTRMRKLDLGGAGKRSSNASTVSVINEGESFTEEESSSTVASAISRPTSPRVAGAPPSQPPLAVVGVAEVAEQRLVNEARRDEALRREQRQKSDAAGLRILRRDMLAEMLFECGFQVAMGEGAVDHTGVMKWCRREEIELPSYMRPGAA